MLKPKFIQLPLSAAPSFLWVAQKALLHPLVFGLTLDTFLDFSCFWSFPREEKWPKSGLRS